MGNNNSSQHGRECSSGEVLDKISGLTSYNLNSCELIKIGEAVGIKCVSIESLKMSIDLFSLSKYFQGDLKKFYIGLFSFCCKNRRGEITFESLVKTIDSFFYSNDNCIVKYMIAYIMSINSDETNAIRLMLSIVHQEIRFLLCFSDINMDDNNCKPENERDILNSIMADFDFEFVIKKYLLKRSSEDYLKLSASDAINEFIQEYLPLFTVLMRFAIRVHFDITPHPNSIKTVSSNESNIKRCISQHLSEINLSSSGTADSRVECSSERMEKGNWIDSNSRILSVENCSVLRCQYFGDISSGEFLTLFQPWNILYASWKHGLSLHRLINSIEGYSSHVLFLIRTVDNCVFGAVCVGDWKEGNGNFSGDETCFLVSLKPIFSVIGQTGKGRNFMYINSKYEFSTKGIGFGGEPEYSRLWLDPSLSTGSCMKTDLTYESGMLYLPVGSTSKRNSCLLLGTPYSSENDESTSELSKFSVADIEVWGFGGEEVLKNYFEMKATSDYFRQERKVIDRSKFIKNEFDKEFLLGNTYSKGK